MVITTTFHNYVIKRILVDQGNLANFLYNIIAMSMNITRSNLKPCNGILIGFLGNKVLVKGTVRLKVTLETWPTIVNMDIGFLIINAQNNTYNAILGRV